MKSAHDTTTLEAAIERNIAELNNAILKLTARDELVKQKLTYARMSFFVVAEHALYNDMLAHAIRVLDEHRDAMSFWYVLRSNEAAVKKSANIAGLDLDKLKILSGKLRLVREKTQFHIDRKAVRNPKSVWQEADITGIVFAEALRAMAATLGHTRQQLFGGELAQVTEYDGSDVSKIVKAYEALYGPVHGA